MEKSAPEPTRRSVSSNLPPERTVMILEREEVSNATTLEEFRERQPLGAHRDAPHALRQAPGQIAQAGDRHRPQQGAQEGRTDSTQGSSGKKERLTHVMMAHSSGGQYDKRSDNGDGIDRRPAPPWQRQSCVIES